MVKKVLVLLLGVLILNGATELHQLLKLPFLIQHYVHHRDEDSRLSFIAFLQIHYTEKHHPNDNDDRQDNELPFKSIGNITHIDIPVIEKRMTADINFSLWEKPTIYYQEGVPSHKSFSVFHPPRIM
jgi:hypothetical protein